MKSVNTLEVFSREAMRAILLVIVMTIAPLLVAQDSQIPADRQAVVEIVRLQYRSPDIIRSALTPYLDERGAISQIDHNLIISTSRANLNELERLIDQLDVPPKQLLIRVDFNYPEQSNQVADDAQLDDANTLRPEFTVQSMLVTEGEFSYFNRFQDSAQVAADFASYAEALAQDRQLLEQSIALKAEINGELATLEFAVSMLPMTTESDDTQRQSLNSVLVNLNQWIPLQQFAQGQLFFDAPLSSAVTEESGLAVRIEVMP